MRALAATLLLATACSSQGSLLVVDATSAVSYPTGGVTAVVFAGGQSRSFVVLRPDQGYVANQLLQFGVRLAPSLSGKVGVRLSHGTDADGVGGCVAIEQGRSFSMTIDASSPGGRVTVNPCDDVADMGVADMAVADMHVADLAGDMLRPIDMTPSCGNGVVEGLEACDDEAADAGCSSCTFIGSKLVPTATVVGAALDAPQMTVDTMGSIYIKHRTETGPPCTSNDTNDDVLKLDSAFQPSTFMTGVACGGSITTSGSIVYYGGTQSPSSTSHSAGKNLATVEYRDTTQGAPQVLSVSTSGSQQTLFAFKSESETSIDVFFAGADGVYEATMKGTTATTPRTISSSQNCNGLLFATISPLASQLLCSASNSVVSIDTGNGQTKTLFSTSDTDDVVNGLVQGDNGTIYATCSTATMTCTDGSLFVYNPNVSSQPRAFIDSTLRIVATAYRAGHLYVLSSSGGLYVISAP